MRKLPFLKNLKPQTLHGCHDSHSFETVRMGGVSFGAGFGQQRCDFLELVPMGRPLEGMALGVCGCGREVRSKEARSTEARTGSEGSGATRSGRFRLKGRRVFRRSVKRTCDIRLAVRQGTRDGHTATCLFCGNFVEKSLLASPQVASRASQVLSRPMCLNLNQEIGKGKTPVLSS